MSDSEKNPNTAPVRPPLGASLLGEYGSRKCLLVSVALNIFFIAAAGAYLARHYLAYERQGPEHTWRGRGDRNAARRIEALAEHLPENDATALRAEFARRAGVAEDAHQAVHRKKDAVRRALRAEPFDAVVARSAMAESRAAHEVFMEVLQDVIATAAAAMSPEGRRHLAEFGRGERRGGK